MITLARLSFEHNCFSRRYEPLQDLSRHSRPPTLSSTLFYDNFVKFTVIFVILLHKTVLSIRNSLDNNLINVNNKKTFKAMRALL